MLPMRIQFMPILIWPWERNSQRYIARTVYKINKKFTASHILGKQLDYTSASGCSRQYYQEVNEIGTRKLL